MNRKNRAELADRILAASHQETDEAKERHVGEGDLLDGKNVPNGFVKEMADSYEMDEFIARNIIDHYHRQVLSKHRPAPAAQGCGEGLDDIQKSVGYKWARSNESLLCMQPYHGGGELRLATHVEEKMIFEIEKLIAHHPLPSTEGKVTEESTMSESDQILEVMGFAMQEKLYKAVEWLRHKQPHPDSAMAKELRALIKRRKEAGQAVCCDIWATEINTILDRFEKQEAK